MGVFVKKTGSINNTSKIKAHIKYIGFRSREVDEKTKGFFDRNNNGVNYKEFLDRVKNDKALQHPKSVKAQKLIFSLRENDYANYKKSGKDFKHLIRATLKEYESKKGVKLDWIASTHEKEGHPHTHIIIKAVSDRKGNEKSKRIYFKKEDFKDLKEIFNKNFEKEVQYDRAYELHHSKEFKNIIKDINKGFDKARSMSKGLDILKNSIDREIKRNEMEKEMEKQKQLRKQKGKRRGR